MVELGGGPPFAKQALPEPRILDRNQLERH
jgi:hypothetical protein